MKSKTIIISAIISLCMVISCGKKEKHFLKDANYREKVERKFEQRKALAEGRNEELFSVFDKHDLTTQEREALEFLYAYMPLSDLADYNGEFYLQQVREALKARDTFEWGKKVPDDLFRHFVLVPRVNNENLDNARGVFFDELKDRVKGKSMEDAVLDVNHWCHEKITYRGTDSRTSSPLALAKTSWGRCGEQSTFTVMALRSVGIPARQCYTPRWVHTDDNHAWVEAWVDGKWRFIGASEPEEELDTAWFTAPARRAMMVHTNIYGDYDGPEDKTYEDNLYSIINVLDTYADTRHIDVKVVDKKDQPVPDATVEFEVYNYAEFYPISTVKTDAKGIASLKTNALGDIMVWAYDNGDFGYKKIEPTSPNFTIKLDSKLPEGVEEFTMNVPPEQAIKAPDAKLAARNAILLQKEDSIRNAYMATFINEESAVKFAQQNGLNPKKTWEILQKSQGNWKEVSKFMKDYEYNEYLFDYLNSLSDKDLRDTPAEYLSHHLGYGKAVGIKDKTPDNFYAPYVFSPRINNELIRPWRGYLQSKFSQKQIEEFQHNPALLQTFVDKNIKVTNKDNYYNSPVSPQGVYEMGMADKNSRNIFYVALARSLGIPARLEPSTSQPQYYENNKWVDVVFDAPEADKIERGKVKFTNNAKNIIKPLYSKHYTISRFENNRFKTLDFEDDEQLKNLPASVDIPAGLYRLTIGTRANNGSVLVNNSYFEVKPNQTVTQDILLPELKNLIQVQGIIDPNTNIELDDQTVTSLKPLMNGKGLVLVFAEPDKEPTKHILQDLPAVKDALDKWGGGVLFMVPDDKKSSAFDASVFKELPENTVWATDKNRKLLNYAIDAIQLDFKQNFPVVLYINNNGGVLYSSAGYRIGIGEDLMKTIKTEQATARNENTQNGCKP